MAGGKGRILFSPCARGSAQRGQESWENRSPIELKGRARPISTMSQSCVLAGIGRASFHCLPEGILTRSPELREARSRTMHLRS